MANPLKCRLCNNETWLLLDLGMQPLANKYPVSKAEIDNEQKWQMNVMTCQNCKCAQMEELINRDLMFENYYYLSSINKELVNHFEQLAIKISDANFVLDIGSNDGILLRPLKEFGVKCLGIDPSKNVGKIANDNGLDTIIGFFDKENAEFIKVNHGEPDYIIASSIFTHLESPIDFISDLNLISNNNTKIIIEIEYLGNLINNLQFERFYFDRPFYYSVESMKLIFGKFGFTIIEIEEIQTHGGSLRFTFQKDGSNVLVNKSVLKFQQREKTLLDIKILRKFSEKVNEELNNFIEKLRELKNSGKKVSGYGCPARLATITNLGQIGSDLIDCIFEDSPLKIKKYTPGMNIPIVDSLLMKEKHFDALVVFAYEYIDSIYEKTSEFRVPHYSPIPFTLLKEY